MRHPKEEIFKVPNRDTYFGPYTLCPKAVLQKGYVDKIGKSISYMGVPKIVTDVVITEEFIIVSLEPVEEQGVVTD